MVERVEVVRVLVYSYATEEQAREDMGRWSVPPEGVHRVDRMDMRIESMLVKQPKRTARQQRVLDIANTMVRARNETARGTIDAEVVVAVIEPEGEKRINVPGAIDTEVVRPVGPTRLGPDDPLDQFGARDPYRPATWLNPHPETVEVAPMAMPAIELAAADLPLANDEPEA